MHLELDANAVAQWPHVPLLVDLQPAALLTLLKLLGVDWQKLS
jgi:hypothetical protein